jgi:hypothetical protein
VEVGHIMEGEEAGLPIYAALGARPKRPLPPLPVPPPKPARLRVVAEVHPSSRSSESSVISRWKKKQKKACRRQLPVQKNKRPGGQKTPTRGG